MTSTIFVTAPRLAPSGVELLAQAGARVIYLEEASGADAVPRVLATEPVDAIISRTVELSAAAIEACPTLKVISKHGVGVSNIDVEAATRRGIPVYVTPGANAQSVAEMTLGLMLTAARRIAWLDAGVRAGRWVRAQDGIELSGKTLALVGLGQIGQRVAAVGLALGMEVVAFDPGVQASPLPSIRLLPSLEALLPLADVLSLHVPLNRHTRGMLGAGQLARMPRGALFINTSRGDVVDETALIAALQSGQLSAAGLDTMAHEPLPAGHALATLPNVVLTPHVGGSTRAALENMAGGAVRNVLGWLYGQPVDPRACMNPQVLTRPSHTKEHDHA